MITLTTFRVTNTTNFLHNYVIFENIFMKILKKSTRIDAIDSFTNDLVKSKKEKWENVKLFQEIHLKVAEKFSSAKIIPTKNIVKNNIKEFNDDNNDIITIEQLNSNQIDNFLLILINNKEYDKLFQTLEKCLEFNKKITQPIVMHIIESIDNEKDHKSFIKILLELIKINKSAIDIQYQNIIAQYFWREGYARKSLDLLEDSYKKSSILNRSKIRKIFRLIIQDTVNSKGEAVLLSVIKLSEDINDKYDDVFIIAYVWQTCFRSKWFSDQNIALDLFNKHKTLQELVTSKTSTICSSLLYEHNIEAVHRLIELFLRRNLKSESEVVLICLFEYHCNYFILNYRLHFN